jgi:hypothetical protein
LSHLDLRFKAQPDIRPGDVLPNKSSPNICTETPVLQASPYRGEGPDQLPAFASITALAAFLRRLREHVPAASRLLAKHDSPDPAARCLPSIVAPPPNGAKQASTTWLMGSGSAGCLPRSDRRHQPGRRRLLAKHEIDRYHRRLPQRVRAAARAIVCR